MTTKPEVVARVPFGEGPSWCPDGTVVCTSTGEGRLYRVWPQERRAEVLAETGGGANSCALDVNGGFLVTQNGGSDYSKWTALPGLTNPPPYRPVTPGLQYVSPNGTVEYVATTVDDGTPMHAPNDLVVMPDGTVYFTDPGHFPIPDPPIGRILKLTRDGVVSVVDEPYRYCNGIGLDHTGTVLVIEDRGILRLYEDGTREWLVERLGRRRGDGFAVDVEGHAYVCCTADNCVRVIDPNGREVDRLDLSTFAEEGMVTNCCFGGADRRTLFATHSLPHGTLVMWEDLPYPGVPVHPWPGLR